MNLTVEEFDFADLRRASIRAARESIHHNRTARSKTVPVGTDRHRATRNRERHCRPPCHTATQGRFRSESLPVKVKSAREARYARTR